jgi:hypothetical protein
VFWGRRRRRAVDRDLIERSSASRTPSVFRLADGQALPGRPVDRALPAHCGQNGPEPGGPAQICQIWPDSSFFSRKLFNLL